MEKKMYFCIAKPEKMRSTSNKYQDKHQNGVIFVTSDTCFLTLFFQKKQQAESFGFRSTPDVLPHNRPFTFTGKERDSETGFSHFGARYYDSDLSGLFLSVDPMADKYPSITPYAYCAWNPVKFLDPDGRKVKPYDDRALTAIKNTLPQDARDYVSLNKDGYIDLDRLEQYSGESYNYNCLKELVSSEEYNIEIHLSNSFSYKDQKGQFIEKDESSIMYYFPANDPYASTSGLYNLSTGETGFYGKTLFPDGEGLQNSPNGNIVIHLNEQLTDKGLAESYSHEANGHALLYVRSHGNRERASHKYQVSTDVNTELNNMIVSSTRETIQNNQNQ